MSLPEVSITIDGTEVEVESPTWGHVIGGHGQASIEITESDARKLNIVARESELKIFTGTDTPRFHGRIAAKPRYTADGTAELTAVGYKDLAEKSAGRRLYQSYMNELWENGEATSYSVSDGKYNVNEIKGGGWKFFSPTGTSLANTNSHLIACWVQDSPGDITRIAFDLNGDVDANNGILIRRGTGPSGALTTDGANITSTGSKDRTLGVASDLVAIQTERLGATATIATNLRQLITNLRVNGIAPDDTFTGQEVLVDVGDALGYDTSGVSSSLSTNVLPLDWEDGTWADLIAYVCMLHDGWWRVLDDRGSGPYLEADTWANSRVWKVSQSQGAIVNLAPLEPYDGLIVKWVSRGGRTHQAKAGTTTPGSNVYEVTLADPQKNSDLADDLVTVLLPRVQEEAEAGDIDIISALSDSGLDDIHGALPGDIVEITDSDMGEASQHRIFGVSGSELGVTLHVEPEGLPDESFLALRGLKTSRRKRSVSVRGDGNKEFRGVKAQLYRQYRNDNWAGRNNPLGLNDALDLYNKFQRMKGRKGLLRKEYVRKFLL